APFSQCFKLTNISVNIYNERYTSDDGVLFSKDGTKLICYPCGKIGSYVIPETVKEIVEYSFYCGLINEIIIPEGVEKISEGAFAWCGNLKEIIVPSTVNYIGSYAFADCSCNLDKVVLKNKVCVFGEYPFIDEFKFNSISYDEYVQKYLEANDALCDGNLNLYEEKNTELNSCVETFDNFYFSAKFYCHSGSTAETYAIENGVKYELTHFFEGEWNYDYENNVRTRKCIHCDELQVEELEIEEISGDNFLVVEETVTNGIEGDVEVLKAFDINLKNSEGVHVQPDGTVKVKLPNDWSKKGVYKVYRVNDDGTLTDMNAYRQGSHLVFDTDHFSIYVIVFTPDETTEEEPDTPAEPDTSDCNCICHATGFLNRILAFVYKLIMKLFAMAPVCECGVAHY
ncbi:MAG: leucine-rich repeat domain-containing protein, partial [Clostridia bacterium]|nr:leucine-rich repeat domain-containing protein [Clostridia bacterium]